MAWLPGGGGGGSDRRWTLARLARRERLHHVLDRNRALPAEEHLLTLGLEAVQVQLQLVFARLDVQPLQAAVEVVDSADEIAVDEHLCLFRLHLEPRGAGAIVDAVVVGRRIRVLPVPPPPEEGVVEKGRMSTVDSTGSRARRRRPPRGSLRNRTTSGPTLPWAAADPPRAHWKLPGRTSEAWGSPENLRTNKARTANRATKMPRAGPESVESRASTRPLTVTALSDPEDTRIPYPAADPLGTSASFNWLVPAFCRSRARPHAASRAARSAGRATPGAP